SWLQEAMQAGPDLVAAVFESGPVRDVSDVVIRQLEDVRVPERRAALDLLAQRREELSGYSHDRHVADLDGLDPGLPRLPLPSRELSPHGAESLDHRTSGRWVFDSLGAVGDDRPVVVLVPELTHADGDLRADRVDPVHRVFPGRIKGGGDRLPDPVGGL